MAGPGHRIRSGLPGDRDDEGRLDERGLITDGVFLPDGRMLLRGYGKAFVLDRPESAQNGRISTLADARLPDQEQGESITVTADGKEALIGSEGKRQPVLQVPVPGVEDLVPPTTRTVPVLPPAPIRP